jgi:hypothetical protein
LELEITRLCDEDLKLSHPRQEFETVAASSVSSPHGGLAREFETFDIHKQVDGAFSGMPRGGTPTSARELREDTGGESQDRRQAGDLTGMVLSDEQRSRFLEVVRYVGEGVFVRPFMCHGDHLHICFWLVCCFACTWGLMY